MLNNHLLELFFSFLILGAILTVLWRRKRKVVFSKNSRVPSPDMQLGAIPTFRRSLPQLTNELARVRRYNRPLSIIVLRIESDQLLLDLKRSLSSDSGNGSVSSYNSIIQTLQLVFSLVGSILRESLRESDIACYDVANNQYVIMLPECTRHQALQTVRRLKKLLFKRTAGHLVAGLSEFPSDGLIIEDLVKRAMETCQPKSFKLSSGSDVYDADLDEN